MTRSATFTSTFWADMPSLSPPTPKLSLSAETPSPANPPPFAIPPTAVDSVEIGSAPASMLLNSAPTERSITEYSLSSHESTGSSRIKFARDVAAIAGIIKAFLLVYSMLVGDILRLFLCTHRNSDNVEYWSLDASHPNSCAGFVNYIPSFLFLLTPLLPVVVHRFTRNSPNRFARVAHRVYEIHTGALRSECSGWPYWCALARGSLTMLPLFDNDCYIIGGCVRVVIVLVALLLSFHWKPFDNDVEKYGNRFQIMLFAFAVVTAANTVAFLAQKRAIVVSEYKHSWRIFEWYAAIADLGCICFAGILLGFYTYKSYKDKVRSKAQRTENESFRISTATSHGD